MCYTLHTCKSDTPIFTVYPIPRMHHRHLEHQGHQSPEMPAMETWTLERQSTSHTRLVSQNPPPSLKPRARIRAIWVGNFMITFSYLSPVLTWDLWKWFWGWLCVCSWCCSRYRSQGAARQRCLQQLQQPRNGADLRQVHYPVEWWGCAHKLIFATVSRLL